MKKIGIAFLAAAALAGVGCSKGGDMTKKMTEFKDKMCGCADKKDADCAKKVTDEMQAWAKDNADKVDKSTKPTEEQEKVGKESRRVHDEGDDGGDAGDAGGAGRAGDGRLGRGGSGGG